MFDGMRSQGAGMLALFSLMFIVGRYVLLNMYLAIILACFATEHSLRKLRDGEQLPSPRSLPPAQRPSLTQRTRLLRQRTAAAVGRAAALCVTSTRLSSPAASESPATSHPDLSRRRG